MYYKLSKFNASKKLNLKFKWRTFCQEIYIKVLLGQTMNMQKNLHGFNPRDNYIYKKI